MLGKISECFHTCGIQTVNEPHALQRVLTSVSKSANFNIYSN